MPNWKRIIVGDAFRIPTRNPNYYRDLILLPPFTLFTLGAVIVWLDHGITDENASFVRTLAIGSAVFILLAKERVHLLVAAIGFVGFRFLLGFVFSGEWLMLLGVAGAVGAIFSIGVIRGNWNLSYGLPEKFTVLELSLGVASFGGTMALLFWISPYAP